MELVFYYKRTDIVAAYRNHYRKLVNTWKDVGMAIVTFILGYAINYFAGMNFMAFSLFAVSIIFLLIPIITILILPYLIAASGKFKGPQQWVFNKETYTINGKSHAIKDVDDIKENQNQFRIYRDINDFSVLPKHSFAHLNNIAEFRKYFSKYLFTFE